MVETEFSKERALREAVEAGKTGNQIRARELLLQLLRSDNREPLYWLLMSTAVDAQTERIYCLQNVLFLDPGNSAALHDLKLLGVEIPIPGTPAPSPQVPNHWKTMGISAPKIPKKRKAKSPEPWSLSWIIAGLGLSVVVVMLAYYAAQTGFMESLIPATPSRLLAQLTGTPKASGTTAAIENLIIPLNSKNLLDEAHTPTPLYVNTPHPGSNDFERGLAAMDREDWASAAELFQNVVVADPASADAAYFLGTAEMNLGHLGEALDAFERALATNPEFAPGYLGRAEVAIAQGADPSTILTDLNSAILLDPNFIDAYLVRIAYNLDRGNPEDASADLSVAEELAPNSVLVQYQKARLLLAVENFSGALEASQRAFEIDRSFLPNYPVKAEAEQGVEQHANSIVTMQTYLAYRGEDAHGWELLGLGYLLNNQKDLAIQAFRRALELDPGLPNAAYYQGLKELEDENPEAALGYFRVAVSGQPDWFEARMGLARAYLGLGSPSSAFFEINGSSRLIQTDEQRALFFYWRATVLEALGQVQTAIADWESLVNLPASAVPTEWRQMAEDKMPIQ